MPLTRSRLCRRKRADGLHTFSMKADPSSPAQSTLSSRIIALMSATYILFLVRRPPLNGPGLFQVSSRSQRTDINNVNLFHSWYGCNIEPVVITVPQETRNLSRI